MFIHFPALFTRITSILFHYPHLISPETAHVSSRYEWRAIQPVYRQLALLTDRYCPGSQSWHPSPSYLLFSIWRLMSQHLLALQSINLSNHAGPCGSSLARFVKKSLLTVDPVSSPHVASPCVQQCDPARKVSLVLNLHPLY